MDLQKSIQRIRAETSKASSIDVTKQIEDLELTPAEIKVLPLVNQHIYFLNKSNSKYICVGLSPHLNFAPIVKICDFKNQLVVLNKLEWLGIIENEGVICNYFHSNSISGHPNWNIGTLSAICESIGQTKVLQFVDSAQRGIYLGCPSIDELFALKAIINQRLCALEKINFNEFYKIVINAAKDLPGDIKENIKKIIDSIDGTLDLEVCLMREILHVIPDFESLSIS